MVIGILIGALILFITEVEAWGNSPDNDMMILVFDLSATFKSDTGFASTVSELMRKELKAMGSFTVLKEDDVKKVLSQHVFYNRDTCKSPVCMSDIGHYIGVHRIIYGSIASINNYYTIALRLLNVPREEITATVMGDLKGDNESVYSREVQSLIQNLLVKDRNTPLTPSENAEQLSEQKETGTRKFSVETDRIGSDIVVNGEQYEEKKSSPIKKHPVGKHKIVVGDTEEYGVEEITLSSVMSHLATVTLPKKKEKVHISSTPEKANVIIDGKEYGETPLTTDLWIGSHRLELVKANYLKRELKITVDSSIENRVEVELEGIATVSVFAEPDYAHIYINGGYVGAGTVENHSVKEGDVEVLIEAPEYEVYKTAETIEMGKNLTIEKKLDYLFGSMDIESSPGAASLYLNDFETGITPYTHTRLRTGKYELRVIKNNYTDITEDVVIQPNSLLKRAYTLRYTKAYRDSVIWDRWLSNGARRIRRVIFGALGAVCGAAGYYFELKLQENKKKYSYWEDEYNNTKDMDVKRFEEIKENYYLEYNQAKKNRSNRNMFISVAAVCGAGFFISIIF